jgi:hypothetical protein
MHRQGGAKVRGLNPPDDIRHRELKWDKKTDMWVLRDFKRLNRAFSSKPAVNASFFGDEGTSTRIGRASLLRGQPEAEYRLARRRAGRAPVGPYLPLIVEACREKEFSYEYRHGVTSHGAFTYVLCQELRRRKRISFKQLVEVAAAKLADLGYEQRPQILGPKRSSTPGCRGLIASGIDFSVAKRSRLAELVAVVLATTVFATGCGVYSRVLPQGRSTQASGFRAGSGHVPRSGRLPIPVPERGRPTHRRDRD